MSGQISRRVLLVAAAGALLLSGCTAPAQDAGPVRIVVTTNILGDVVERVVGDAAEVTTLMKPNADPHSFAVSARESALMAEADLLVTNGLGLEEGLEQHLSRAAASGSRLFAAGEHLEVLDYAPEAGTVTPDPHFWTDPQRMVDVVDALGKELATVEGIDIPAVEAGVRDYRAQLLELDERMRGSFAGIPAERRALVTNHHVFGYLAQRYDFKLVGAVIPGGTTLAAPSAADLDGLATAIRESGVPAIFAESSQPDRLVQALAEESGVHVEVVELFSESLSEPGAGAGTYLEMMYSNTERITGGLG